MHKPKFAEVLGTMILIIAMSRFCVTCKKIHSDRNSLKAKSPFLSDR